MSATGQTQPSTRQNERVSPVRSWVIFGASLSSALVYIGRNSACTKPLSDAGPATPAELAQRTNTNER